MPDVPPAWLTAKMVKEHWLMSGYTAGPIPMVGSLNPYTRWEQVVVVIPEFPVMYFHRQVNGYH